MPRIYLSDFVDVVSKLGSPKATKVREIKNRAAYVPATDFYKPLREGIVEVHRNNQDKSFLTGIAASADPKKVASYEALVKGYRKWWGLKQISWFSPPRSTYSAHGVDVVVNPNLGLDVNGHPHVLKLHLKADKLTKVRADLICELMAKTLTATAPSGATMAVLDVRNAKLFVAGSGPLGLTAMVDAELAYVSSLWPNV